MDKTNFELENRLSDSNKQITDLQTRLSDSEKQFTGIKDELGVVKKCEMELKLVQDKMNIKKSEQQARLERLLKEQEEYKTKEDVLEEENKRPTYQTCSKYSAGLLYRYLK